MHCKKISGQVKSLADSACHCIFLVIVTKLFNDGHYLPQISLSFHQVFYAILNIYHFFCAYKALLFYSNNNYMLST